MQRDAPLQPAYGGPRLAGTSTGPDNVAPPHPRDASLQKRIDADSGGQVWRTPVLKGRV